MSQFFRSLLLSFCTPIYLTANSSVNYDCGRSRLLNPLGNHDNSLTMDKSLAESISFPIILPDISTSARLKREEIHRSQSRRALHRSFGVTSKVFRRDHGQRNDSSERPLKRTADGHLTTKKKIPRTFAAAGTETKLNTTTTTTAFPLPPNLVLPSGTSTGKKPVNLSDILGSQSYTIGAAVSKIRDYIKTYKKTKVKGKKKEVKPRTFLYATPFLHVQKDIDHVDEVKQLQLKFIEDKMISESAAKKTKQKLQKNRMEGISQTTPFEYIRDLGAKIEAEEAERMTADGENPLKYMVKDGILYKKNRIPVARISLARPDALPAIPDNIEKMVRSIGTQTMVASSPIISEQTIWPIHDFSPDKTTKLRDSFNSPLPLSPLTVNASKVDADVKKSRGEGHDRIASLLSRTADIDNLMEEPRDVLTNDLIVEERNPPPYPFSHCYMNMDGFMCCNRFLESLMRRSYRKLQKGYRFHECSVQKIANRIQRDSENVFNTTFETVVGIDDFAVRAHFAGDLMCKIQEGGRFITNYATIMPSRVGVPPDPLSVVTNMGINTRNGKEEQPSSQGFPKQIDGVVQHVQVPDQRRPRSNKEGIPFHEKSREDIENDNIITKR